MKKNGPFFSVITCTWNRAHLLQRAIDSLVGQTETSWEAIVVDDGSTDHTEEVIQSYIVKDERIRYVRHPNNVGVAAARNTGIRYAQGTWITFLDSDDAYAPEHLTRRRTCIENNAHGEMLVGGYTVIGDPYVADRFDPTKRIHVNECVVGGTFVIHKGVFQRIGVFANIPYADDSEFFDRA